MWRWVIFIGVPVILLGAIIYAALTAAEPVDTVQVMRGTVEAAIEDRGETELPRTERITMPFAGTIEPIELEPGDRISDEQVLARLDAGELRSMRAGAEARIAAIDSRIALNDDTRLEDLALEELPHIIRSVGLAVEAAGEQVRASEARVGFAGRQLERVREIYAEAATHPRELDEAELLNIESEVDRRQDELSWRAAEAIERAITTLPQAVEHLKQRKALARAVLERERAEAEAELARIDRDIERATLRSRGEAVVIERHVDGAEDLAAGAVLLELGRPETMRVRIEVLSSEAYAISEGDRVELRGLHGDRVQEGRVSGIRPRAKTVVSSLGVEEQRIAVIIEFSEAAKAELAEAREAGRGVGAGYRVWARIVTDAQEDTLFVPRTALYRGEDDAWHVLAVRDGRAVAVAVEIGLGDDQRVEIRDGLEERDQVILSPDEQLSPGQRVRPR